MDNRSMHFTRSFDSAIVVELFRVSDAPFEPHVAFDGGVWWC